MPNKVYDTNVLLDNPHIIAESENRSEICITWTVLRELDGLKNRTYKAREVIRQIAKFKEEVTFIGEKGAPNNDDLIVKEVGDNADTVLITNDELMAIKAYVNGLDTEKYVNKSNDISIYDNPVKIYFSNEDVAEFYSNGTLLFESKAPYVIAVCEDGNKPFAMFKRVFSGYELMNLDNMSEINLTNNVIGEIIPKDIYQKIAIDSLKHNQMTILTGAAGTGKTLLSLAYILQALDSGEYKRAVIFTNPVKVRDTVDLGAYKGDRGDKLLQQSIGSMLASKIGDIIGVEYLLQGGKLVIYPFSDIRGIEIRNDEILYLPEMQNSSIDLAKLAVQRASSKTKIIAEGDMDTQVDMSQFEGSNNGLRRYVEVLNGKPGIAHIHLPNNYRSKISSWAEEM